MTTFQRTITDTNDDAHERADGTGFNASANPMLFRSHGTAASRSHVGLRFPNVTIPAGSTINSATVTIDIVGTANDDIDGTIWGNDVDDAANFVTEADVTSRTQTTASVAWTQAAAGAGSEVSPDITSIIQEIVDRGGWASGQALCILLFGDNAALQSCTLDDGTATGAILDIDYTAPAGGLPERGAMRGVGRGVGRGV